MPLANQLLYFRQLTSTIITEIGIIHEFHNLCLSVVNGIYKITLNKAILKVASLTTVSKGDTAVGKAFLVTTYNILPSEIWGHASRYFMDFILGLKRILQIFEFESIKF